MSWEVPFRYVRVEALPSLLPLSPECSLPVRGALFIGPGPEFLPHRPDEGFEAFPGHRRNWNDGVVLSERNAPGILPVVLVCDVHLGEGHDARLFCQLAVDLPELVEENLVLLFGPIARRFYQEYEHPRTFDMLEEFNAEAFSLVGALDETRHIRHDEALVFGVTHQTEVRDEGRERVIGDLRLGGGDSGYERRLARIRKAHKPHIGEELQLEPDQPRSEEHTSELT